MRLPGSSVEVSDPRAVAALRRVERFARLSDERFRVPGTRYRFGLDAIIGLVPVIGDTATFLASLYPVSVGHRLGLRKRTLLRMLGNIALDWLVGLIPMVDVFLDTAFKANRRNANILADAVRRRNEALEHTTGRHDGTS